MISALSRLGWFVLRLIVSGLLLVLSLLLGLASIAQLLAFVFGHGGFPWAAVAFLALVFAARRIKSAMRPAAPSPVTK